MEPSHHKATHRVETTAEGYHTNRYEDRSADLWSTYLSKSEKYDKVMAQNWKGDMDSLLIFAGLFSASVTAFIIESYKTLNPDSGDLTVALLAQISEQLTSLSVNGTSYPFSQALEQQFEPPVSALICNVLWFLSLSFSLICAVSATLVEQWTRQFVQATDNRPAPQDRARLRAYLFEGIEKYKMATLVEIIPMLLHMSLFLFFAGLVAFLGPINASIKQIMFVILILCCILYGLVTILPIFRLCCPYWTPLSSLIWSFLYRFNLRHRCDVNGTRIPIHSSMSETREADAIDISRERDKRDVHAICWTVCSLREDHEFEAFVDVIPNVVSGIDYSAKWLMDTLMIHDDINVRLGTRIPRLLISCYNPQMDRDVAQRRAITCLKAIWSLTMLSIPQQSSHQLDTLNRSLSFVKEDILRLFQNVTRVLPQIYPYAISAAVALSRSRMDIHLETLVLSQDKLQRFTDQKIERQDLLGDHRFHHDFLRRMEVNIESLHRGLHDLGDYVLAENEMATTFPHILITSIADQYNRLVLEATSPISGQPNSHFNDQIVDLLKSFHQVLNQAGFNLALQYMAHMLDSDILPHEAFNTLRRTSFRINSQLPLTVKSQRRLVHYLSEATEHIANGSTRLPQSIVDILLGLTRVLSEPSLILKAKKIVEEYSTTALPGGDAARATLSMFERKLPHDITVSPVLDLFSLHVYADTRPLRKLSKGNGKLNRL